MTVVLGNGRRTMLIDAAGNLAVVILIAGVPVDEILDIPVVPKPKEGADRLIAAIEIGDQKRQVLRRMAGRVFRAHADAAELNSIAVVKDVRLSESLFRIAPFTAAVSGQMKSCSGGDRESTGAGKVVRVNVGLGHVRDANTIRACGARVHGDIRAWINEDRLPALLAGDHITRLRQIVVVKAFEKHRCLDVTGAALLAGRTSISVLLKHADLTRNIHRREF